MRQKNVPDSHVLIVVFAFGSMTHRMKNPTGNVVGQDDNGNVYMEDMTCQFGKFSSVTNSEKKRCRLLKPC